MACKLHGDIIAGAPAVATAVKHVHSLLAGKLVMLMANLVVVCHMLGYDG